jgi:galactose-1-phosphate uridylyltransferase
MVPKTPLIERLPDGTLRHFHPVTGLEIRNVWGRSFRPNRTTPKDKPPQPLTPSIEPENTCDFCASRRMETPPEKKRWWRDPSRSWQSQSFRPPAQVGEGACDFRRISNLFEIVPYDYWTKNLGFTPTVDRLAWRDAYFSDPSGQQHIEALLRNKLKNAGWDATRLATLDPGTIRKRSESFFFGSHDLIISNRHYNPGARLNNDIQSSGDLDPETHFHYLQAASETASDILTHNPLAQYVAVFQNWLSPAGASFEHLHKQILGSDRPGPYPDALLQASLADPDLFNRRFLTPALEQNWGIASNAHAIAVGAFGIAYPAIWIFSKSRKARPWELSADEFRGFSDLLHACHAATGSDIPTNEEWMYSPPGSPSRIPFHVTLKWRVNVHAGFEGVSGITINPMSPGELKERLLEKMRFLQESGRLGDVTLDPRSTDSLPPLEIEPLC